MRAGTAMILRELVAEILRLYHAGNYLLGTLARQLSSTTTPYGTCCPS
jgi:hypothetical protein